MRLASLDLGPVGVVGPTDQQDERTCDQNNQQTGCQGCKHVEFPSRSETQATRGRCAQSGLSIAHPASSISREAIKKSQMNDASIGVVLFDWCSVYGPSSWPSNGLAGRTLLAPSMSPAKNVGITLHGFPDGGMMDAEPLADLTLILGKARAGDHRSRDELVARVYDELRQVAARLMRKERRDHTLPPTAVVHEAVIRMLGDATFEKSPDRAFLFASAARAMREVLIDHARRRSADRRGGGRQRVPLDLVVEYFQEQGLDVVAVHEALDRLAEFNERQSQVMTLRYFGGLTVPEVAAALEVSVVTVERDWRLARAWIRDQLREADE